MWQGDAETPSQLYPGSRWLKNKTPAGSVPYHESSLSLKEKEINDARYIYIYKYTISFKPSRRPISRCEDAPPTNKETEARGSKTTKLTGARRGTKCPKLRPLPRFVSSTPAHFASLPPPRGSVTHLPSRKGPAAAPASLLTHAHYPANTPTPTARACRHKKLPGKAPAWFRGEGEPFPALHPPRPHPHGRGDTDS